MEGVGRAGLWDGVNGVLKLRSDGVTRGGEVEDSGGWVDQGEVVRGTGGRGVIEVVCFPEGNSGAGRCRKVCLNQGETL